MDKYYHTTNEEINGKILIIADDEWMSGYLHETLEQIQLQTS